MAEKLSYYVRALEHATSDRYESIGLAGFDDEQDA